MPQIVVINGPSGVGKTTVSQLLAKTNDNSVCISGDQLKAFIVHRTKKVKGRLAYKNGASLIKNFLAARYDLIIFEFIFPSKRQMDYFFQELHPNVPSLFVTLWASWSVTQQRIRSRAQSKLSVQSLEKYYLELEKHQQDFDILIETDQLTPDEVLHKLNKLLKPAEQNRCEAKKI